MSKVLLSIGTEKGAFFLTSDANRERWEISEPQLRGWKVGHIMLDQRSSPKMFACTGSYVYGPTLNVSDDFGKNWRQIEKGPAYAENAPGKLTATWCVASGHADEPDKFYAGVADAGIFVSRDGGENWRELKGLSEHPTREEWSPGLGGLCCHTILQHPTNKKRIWAAISAVGVFRSDDAGETWQVKNDGLTIVIEGQKHKNVGSCVHRLVLDAQNPDCLYQQNHKGVFRSRNGGDSWERIETGLATNFGFPMVIHPRDSQTLFIVPQESDEFRFPKDGKLTVCRSTDGGDSWHSLRNGLPDNAYTGVLRQAMAVDSLDDCGVYFGTSGGQIYYSRNTGENWQAMPFLLPRINSVSAAVL